MTERELIISDKLRFTAVELIFAHRYTLDSSWRDDPIPPWNALIYIIRGSIRLTVHNTAMIADDDCLISLAQFQYHDMYIREGETADVMICCYRADCGSEAEGKTGSALGYIHIPNIIRPEHNECAELKQLFSELVRADSAETASDIFGRVEKMARLIRRIAELSQPEIRQDKRGGFDFSDTLSFIDRYYCQEKLTISKLSARLNVSEAHFMREFKKKYGISCKKYIQLKRINKALEMLRGSDASVSDIAQQCMFDTGSYMSELIKRETGMSPTEYRRNRT